MKKRSKRPNDDSLPKDSFGKSFKQTRKSKKHELRSVDLGDYYEDSDNEFETFEKFRR